MPAEIFFQMAGKVVASSLLQQGDIPSVLFLHLFWILGIKCRAHPKICDAVPKRVDHLYQAIHVTGTIHAHMKLAVKLVHLFAGLKADGLLTGRLQLLL